MRWKQVLNEMLQKHLTYVYVAENYEFNTFSQYYLYCTIIYAK